MLLKHPIFETNFRQIPYRYSYLNISTARCELRAPVVKRVNGVKRLIIRLHRSAGETREKYLPTALRLTSAVETLITGLKNAGLRSLFLLFMLKNFNTYFSSCFCSSTIISSSSSTYKSTNFCLFAILQFNTPSCISLCFVKSKFYQRTKVTLIRADRWQIFNHIPCVRIIGAP